MPYKLALLVAVMLVQTLHAAEPLGPEGFPADWTPADFEVDDLPATTKPSPTGVASIPVANLPRVAADPSLTPILTSSSVAVTLTNPMPQLPVVAVDDVGRIPDDLAKLDSWGPLTDMAGGVSEKAWKGVSASAVVERLSRIQPQPLESRTLADVVSRLLLTRAKPAADTSPTAGALLAARAEALDKLGMDEQAYALWRVVPPLARNAENRLAQGWAMASVVAGQTAEPCALARKLVVGATSGPWPELAVVCTALDRASGGLDMGLNVAAEQTGFDPVLRQLLIAVRDDDVPAKLPVNATFKPLSAAVMAVYPALLEQGSMDKLPAIVLRRLLQSQNLPLGLRLEAAEILLNRTPNAVAAESLRVLYEAQSIPPDQVATALTTAKTLNGLSARTLLWQGLRTLPVNTDKLAAWQALASSAATSNRPEISLWLGPTRAGLQPEATLSPTHLATAVRGAWLANDDKVADAWLQTAQTMPSPTAVFIATRAQLGMEHAVRTSTLPVPVLDQWLVTQSLTTDTARTTAIRTLAVMEGAGVKLPEGAWSKLEALTTLQPEVATGNAVAVEALKALAVKDAPLGPVVLKLVEWQQAKPLYQWAPAEARAAVDALAMVGLKREATTLALELMRATPPIAKTTPKTGKTKPVSGTVPTPKLTIQNMKASEPKNNKL
ncbi:MAG: hypothetical protein WAZ18_04810 [Alphaproteobacteria bacterium]